MTGEDKDEERWGAGVEYHFHEERWGAGVEYHDW